MSFPRAPGDPSPLTVQDPIAQLLRDLIHERTGIFFDDARVTTVFEKLEPRLKATDRQGYLDYYYLLKYDDQGADEWLRVMDAFSVQETYFWREVDQVRVLVDEIVPAWFRRTTQPLRIWSAACATGEEPYSIAIALEEGGWGRHPIQIFASDASESALTRARAAVYRERSFRSLPPELRARYFRPQGDQFVLSDEIRARVSFQWLNLMELEKAPELTGLPVIFCRNVFIYFSPQTIRRVVAEFARRMPPQGCLFVGASESLLKVSDDFTLEEMGTPSRTCGAPIQMTMSEPPIIRALIVDDSAFARKVLREILLATPGMAVVGVARDGVEALNLTRELKPDIVICDLKMPNLDGAGFVRAQMKERPLPILIVSAAAGDAAEVVEALHAGAFNVVRKPSALATNDLRSISDELLENIRAAVRAPVATLLAPPPSALVPEVPGWRIAAKVRTAADILVIGISTGGPQALRRLIPQLPADLPVPVAIVLHMPVGYTAMYAEKLDELCPLEVKEAAEGDVLRPGLVLVAAAGRHLALRRTPAGTVVAQLTIQPITKIHRPSVDVLFQSASEVYKERVLAVVMTGMGDDGKEGCAWVKAQGGVVITESEKSCVIYGMPRSVEEAGLSDAVVPLDDMAAAILSHL